MSKNLKANLLIFALGFIVYSYSFSNPFIWDDEILVVKNLYIRSWTNISKIFTSPLFRLYRSKTFFYRPLQELSYTLDFQFWKLNPLGYHLTNTFLHLLNAILFFLIIIQITKDFELSLFSSLLFVIHPIHTQAVTYISSRADLLVGLFLLLAFLSYIKSFYFLSLVFFSFSLFSKECALTFPLILIFYDINLRKVKPSLIYPHTKAFGVGVKHIFPFIIIIFIYLYFRQPILEFVDYQIFPSSANNLIFRIFSLGRVIFIYLGLLAYPTHLHMERTLSLPKSFLELSYLISFLGLLAILAIFFIIHKRSKKIFFFLGWFFIFLLPMLNILKLDTLIAEHWVYLGSLGIFALTIFLLKHLIRTKSLFYFTIIILLIFYSSFSIKRNIEWKNKLNFYRGTLDASPDSIRANYLLGQTLLEEGLYPQAIIQFKKLIALKPDESDPYNILGVAYLRSNELDKAQAAFEQSIKLEPRYADPLNNLGLIYLIKNNDRRAYQQFKKALIANPHHLGAMNNLGLYYKKQGEKDLAEKIWRRVLFLDPFNEKAKSYLVSLGTWDE